MKPGKGLPLFGAGFALLLVALLISRAGRPAVEFGPRQHVETANPKIGMHTRVTDEVEPWKVQHTFELVRQMGAPWVVEYFLWAAAEPQPGVYDWSHADLVVDHAVNQGLTVIARLGYVPEWAQPKDATHLYLDEKGYDAFARFAAEFAGHFKGRVRYVIIWNEPNLSQEWGYRTPNPAEYTSLLGRSYPAIKAANPEMQVLAGALAPTLAPSGTRWAMNDLDYLQGMYAAGAKDSFDLLAAHAYGWTFEAKAPPSEDAVNFRRVELLHDVMVRNGDGAKHVIVTEGGWNDHPRWTKAVRPAQRVRYTIEAYDMALKDWPWVDAVCLWAFRYPRPARTYQDYYTFADAEFRPKHIYYAVQRYAHGLDWWEDK